MMSLRSVVARIIRNYDVKPIPGFNAEGYLNSIADYFNAAAPPLKLIFSKRS